VFLDDMNLAPESREQHGMVGVCRRYAPRARVTTEAVTGSADTYFPWMEERDWCGEWVRA